MKTRVTVADAMTVTPVAISPDTTIYSCCQRMLKKHVGSALVTSGDKLLGIITEKDIINSVVKGLDPKKTHVDDIMSTKLHIAKPDDDILEAIHHMKKNKVRRLPVVHNKKIVGMLTMNDVLRVQPALFEIVREKDVLMGKKPKHIEGICESCDNYGRLSEVDGQNLCSECQEEARK